VLLGREISIPSRKVRKSLSLHRFASTGCLTPGFTGSKAIPARELVKGRTHSRSATLKGSLVSDA
jgi:hypothetical protein